MIKKSLIITCIFVLSALTSSAVFASTKIDPFFDAISHMHADHPMTMKAASINSVAAEDLVSIFVKTRDAETTTMAIEEAGGYVRATISAELLTANIPLDALEFLEAEESIVFMESAKPVDAKNDIAMLELNAYEVHEGLDLPIGYTGKGVIVGIVDTGLDITHNDFSDADGNSRILFVWDQQSTNGPGPEELTNTYGTECDTAQIESGNCPMDDVKGHGTHIAGTAAGRDATFGGVAPDADIIAVRYRQELMINGYATPIFSTTICEAAYYVFKKAEELGRPAVVNMSLGTHIGAHDGTSLFEQCLDELVEGSSGRAIVAAAGNENINHSLFTGIHAGYDMSGDTSKSNFKIRSLEDGRIFYLDTWMSASSDLAFGLIVRSSANDSELGSTNLVALGEEDSGDFDGGKLTWSINATETASALNGQPHVGITIMLDDSVTNPSVYDFDLVVSGSGHFDAWWYPDKSADAIAFTNLEGRDSDGLTYMPGDNEKIVAMPATARNVIAVAGYATRTEWDRGSGCCSVGFESGDILPFSSPGPSGDSTITGQKPEITAPGAMIASARSKDSETDILLDFEDGEHTLGAGTSMATPFVSGTIALMFSADSNYTFEDVRRYITESAYEDSFTGAVPNDNWGYGKLDILAAVQTAVLGGPTGDASANASLSQPDGLRPAMGESSGCSLIPGQNVGYHVVPALLSIFSMVAVVWSVRRRKEKPPLFPGR